MKITRISRPKSQIVTQKSDVMPITSTHKISPIDESFMNQPIDLRKLQIDQLPSSTEIEDDKSLNIPLINNSIPLRSQTNTGKERKDIEDLKKLLTKVQNEQQIKKQQKKVYHLSQHLQPPKKPRYCPEQAYAEHTLHSATVDHNHTNSKKEYIRSFPYDLFSTSFGRTEFIKESAIHQRPKPTFFETMNDREVRDLFA